MSLLKKFLKLFSPRRIKDLLNHVPETVETKFRFVIRLWLKDLLVMPIVVRSTAGSRYFLSTDPLDDIILRELLTTYGPLFYPPEMRMLGPTALILDVGAHHGAYAVTTLSLFPEMRMISVEPDAEGFRILEKNIALNSFASRCELVNAAITDRDGQCLLEKSSEGSWGNTVVTAPRARPSDVVRALSLKSILNGRHVDVVKLNCEGGEYSIVPQLLSLNRLPSVIILLVHPRDGEEAILFSMLTGAGYALRPTCTSDSHPRLVCIQKTIL
jgi:FkbM family methyltransferase